MKVREDFQDLYDSISDENVRRKFNDLLRELDELSSSDTGSFWNGLSDEEKLEILISHEESLDPRNLISHEVVKRKYQKWLKT